MNKEEYLKRTNPRYLMGICHRGFHTNEITENGLKAFQNAIDHSFAFEFDVHLTLDERIVVCHDSDLKRVTGKEGIIEKLTLKEIKEEYSLLDGEKIPTLEEVLDCNQERVPMVCEIKAYNKNAFKVSKKTLEILNNKIKDKKNMTVISFDGFALLPFKGYLRQLLVGQSHPWTWHFRGFFEAVDLDVKLMNTKKAKSYAKKHFLNSWTVDSKNIYDEVKDTASTITFQLMDDEYIKNYQLKKYQGIKINN